MKETILQKASDMFLTLGYKSVTMDDIATEMGISKKTIYQHYSNKNELVEASTVYLFEKISAGIDEICSIGLNSIEEIFTIRNYMMKNLHDETTAPLFQLQKFFPQIFSVLRSRQFTKMHGCMMQNVQRGVQEGLFRADINIEFVTRIYFTGLSGLKDTDIFPIAMFEPNKVTKQFIEYHLRAISTEKGMEILKNALEKY